MTYHPHLPRLSGVWYEGRASVLWTHCLEGRREGWLTPGFHAAFRECLLHCCTRYALACPAYVLMPDHLHLVCCGLHETSDQLRASRHLRRYIAPLLAPYALQPQGHDHVLRAGDASGDRIASAVAYVTANPVRKTLVATPSEWPFTGATVPGYPGLSPFSPDFWISFWKIYNRQWSAGLRVEAY